LRSFTFVVWAVREGFVFVLLEAVCFVCVVVFFFSFLLVVFFLRSVAFARWFFVQQNAAPAERRLPLA
jgi:hypothetical protein